MRRKMPMPLNRMTSRLSYAVIVMADCDQTGGRRLQMQEPCQLDPTSRLLTLRTLSQGRSMHEKWGDDEISDCLTLRHKSKFVA